VPIRFHLDEHISAQIAAGLRRRNIDVTTTADVGLLGATDIEHLEFAASSGRVLVTQDDDFLRLHAQGIAHTGIAYCQQQTAAANGRSTAMPSPSPATASYPRRHLNAREKMFGRTALIESAGNGC
jgi:hypothetical protein